MSLSSKTTQAHRGVRAFRRRGRLSRKTSRIILPSGRWEPEISRKSYGNVVSAFTFDRKRWWCILPLVNLLVQILNTIDLGQTVCNALQSLTMIVLACASMFFGVIRPHRALLASHLTCVSLLLSCLVTLLAMLCRLGSVDRSAVDGFGVFVSAAMMVMKAYHIALPHVEAWLIDRNSCNIPKSTIPMGSLLLEPVRNLSVTTDGHNHRTPNRRSNAAQPISENDSLIVTSLAKQDAETMLRQLVAHICEQKSYCVVANL